MGDAGDVELTEQKVHAHCGVCGEAGEFCLRVLLLS